MNLNKNNISFIYLNSNGYGSQDFCDNEYC